jgi:hypothetical protein
MPGEKSSMQCDAGKMAVVACDGRKGCKTLDDGVYCDRLPPAPKPGDACAKMQGDRCTADSKGYLTCTNGTLVLASTCKGPLGCSAFDESVACDTSVADVGDACASGESCARDGHTLLACVGGKRAESRKCRGPAGCKETRGAVRDCDDSIAEAGEPCNALSHACSVDGKSVLACKDAKFAPEKTCAGATVCVKQASAFACGRP